MPAKRLPMRQVRDVLRLKHACGMSERRRERPLEPRYARPAQVLADRRPPQTERLGDQPG